MSHANDAALQSVCVCVVRVCGENFCLHTLQVREVLSAQQPQTVPLAPRGIAGLLPYRGEVLTVVSLRVLLDQPQASAGCVVVLKDPGDGEIFGLMVDSVEEVMRVPLSTFELNPATLNERRRRVLCGVYKLEDGVMARLDPVQLQPGRWIDRELRSTLSREGQE